MKCTIAMLMVTCFSFHVFAVSVARFSQTKIEPRETNKCDERQSAGLICESCDLLSTCVKRSNGWANIPVETCDTQNGFYCNTLLGGCSNATGPCHPFSFEGNFPCTSRGIFPDPYDCQKYHMCYFVGPTLVSVSFDCGNDKAFNPADCQCSLTITDPVCNEKQFKCQNAGDAHAWLLNPNIFYICKATSNQDERILYPNLYRCEDGEIFDGYFCRITNLTVPFPNIPSGVINLPTTSPPAVIIQPTATASGPRVCNVIGLIADTQDCRKYYYCSVVNGTLKGMECPLGTHFNEAFSQCSFGSCL